MAYSPMTGLVYIPAMETLYTYSRTAAEKPAFVQGIWNLWERTDSPAATDDFPIRGHLAAWDPISQREVWRIQYDYAWNGGVLATAGNLVFQGTTDGRFAAYRADDGKLLWQMPVQTGIIAAPVTYLMDGDQYIAVNAGWGGTWSLVGGQRPALDHLMATDRLLVFKIGGTGQLPQAAPPMASLPEPPALTADPETVRQGGMLYHKICYVCHGVAAVSGGNVADLRYLTPDKHEHFNDIVLGGIYSDLGMAGFADVLTAQDAEALHAYIIKRAREDYQLQTNK
jgi:quinohemoprotein ethanol dehydrogenase